MLEMTLPEKMMPIATKKKRFKIIVGGRGSGKSHSVSDLLLMKVQTESAKIGCFREYQNSIEDSVHSLLKDEISRLEIPGFLVQKSYIDHAGGGRIRFRGLARSITGIKSMQGFKYFFVEEAQFLSESSIKILTPTVRSEDSEIWFVGNPMSSADPFSRRFLVPFQKELNKNGYYEDDMHIIVVMNYRDNPWFPEVLEKERQYDYRTLDRAMYKHIWEGEYNDSVENSIIKAEWVDSCIDAHKKIGFDCKGAVIVSHDPSDLGNDDKALVLRHGSVILDAQTKKTGDVNEGCDWALDYAIRHNADFFVWDCDGMGVSLKRQVNDALNYKKITAVEFRGSNSPDFLNSVYLEPGKVDIIDAKRKTNRQTFKNNRAQKYWALRDRIYNTHLAVTKKVWIDPEKMISFSSEISEWNTLRSEICRIPRKPNVNGLIQIMTKQEMKRLLRIESPNLADALVMSLITPEIADAKTTEISAFINKNRMIRRMAHG